MRAMSCAAATLVVAFTLACGDRDRQDTADRVGDAAQEAGEEIRHGAEHAGDAAEDAVDDVENYSYERRDEFREDVRERLDRMDEELADLERGINKYAAEARVRAVAEAREARSALGRSFERLTTATEANWEELKREVSESLDAAELRLRELRPDAKPMGGTGGPT